MKKYCLLVICVCLSVLSLAQNIKSINIHNDENPDGWIYGLNEIDSITIDDNATSQILNIDGVKVFHKISGINHISFSEEDAPVFYVYVKFLDDAAYYVVRNTGYVRTYADSEGIITELDAFINNVPINIYLNEEQKVQSVRADSLDLYFEYQNSQTVIYGKFFSAIICDTIDVSNDMNSRAKLRRKSGSNTNYWQQIIKTAGDKIKDFSVEKGLNKILGIEFSGSDSYADAVRKAQLRSSLKDLMGIAGMMQDIQKFGDMRAEDILKEVGDMPDLGGIENAAYFGQYIDPTGTIARFNKWIFPPLKNLQDNNNAIKEQSEKEQNRPSLIFNIQTGNAQDITSNSAICSIDGIIRAEANKGDFDFDYGICYSTSSQPTIAAQNAKSTLKSDGFFSSISISLPRPFQLSSLTPNTTYYYRAFLKDNITGNVIYADKIKQFATSVAPPVAITGDSKNITKNSATVSCTYENIPTDGVCGVEYTWNEGSVSKSIGSKEGFQEISLSGLKPGTTYTYCAYIEANGQTYYGGDKTFTTQVELTMCPDGNHPHMIDLGLPSGTKWACCNIGASTPEGYGNYYAWGETSPKSVYNEDTYAYCTVQYTDIGYIVRNVSYVNIGSDIAGTSYDAATANWGLPWHMPSKVQIQELDNSCTSTWTTQNGVEGRKYTGPNGSTIFLPAAGWRSDDNLIQFSYGQYWSSTLYNPDGAYYLDSNWFGSGLSSYAYSRSLGLSVRPVR